MVTAQDTQSARIDPETGVDRILHREVGKGATRVAGKTSMKPRPGCPFEIAREGPLNPHVSVHEGRVVYQSLPTGSIDIEQDFNRVPIPRPGIRIDRRKELSGLGGPTPPEVVGKIVESVYFGWKLDVSYLTTRDTGSEGIRSGHGWYSLTIGVVNRQLER